MVRVRISSYGCVFLPTVGSSSLCLIPVDDLSVKNLPLAPLLHIFALHPTISEIEQACIQSYQIWAQLQGHALKYNWYLIKRITMYLIKSTMPL